MNKKTSSLRPYLPAAIILLVDLLAAAIFPQLRSRLISHTLGNFKEMLSILPPVFLLLGLLDVWVPKETVMRFLGPESGLRGPLLSILLGSAAAGPLYGAFPIAEVMSKKGASYYNMLVFIGTWSTLKIPMILFETKAMGMAFAMTRMICNLIVVFVTATIISRVVPMEQQTIFYQTED